MNNLPADEAIWVLVRSHEEVFLASEEESIRLHFLGLVILGINEGVKDEGDLIWQGLISNVISLVPLLVWF